MLSQLIGRDRGCISFLESSKAKAAEANGSLFDSLSLWFSGNGLRTMRRVKGTRGTQLKGHETFADFSEHEPGMSGCRSVPGARR